MQLPIFIVFLIVCGWVLSHHRLLETVESYNNYIISFGALVLLFILKQNLLLGEGLLDGLLFKRILPEFHNSLNNIIDILDV